MFVPTQVESVAPLVPVPVLIVRAMAFESDVTVLPLASSMVTTGCTVNAVPTTPSRGSVVKMT